MEESKSTIELVNEKDPLKGYEVHCGECGEDSTVSPYPTYCPMCGENLEA